MPSDASIHTLLVLLVHFGLVVVGCWLIVIDARSHRLPNRIVLPTLGVLLVLCAVEALAVGSWRICGRALLASLILASFYAILRGSSGGAVGGGDVKLAAVIGLVLGWHGWTAFVLGAAAAFVFGAFFALILMALRRATRTSKIAFGPWMILGAAAGIALSRTAGVG